MLDVVTPRPKESSEYTGLVVCRVQRGRRATYQRMNTPVTTATTYACCPHRSCFRWVGATLDVHEDSHGVGVRPNTIGQSYIAGVSKLNGARQPNIQRSTGVALVQLQISMQAGNDRTKLEGRLGNSVGGRPNSTASLSPASIVGHSLRWAKTGCLLWLIATLAFGSGGRRVKVLDSTKHNDNQINLEISHNYVPH